MRTDVKHLLESGFQTTERHACELVGVAVSATATDRSVRVMGRCGTNWSGWRWNNRALAIGDCRCWWNETRGG